MSELSPGRLADEYWRIADERRQLRAALIKIHEIATGLAKASWSTGISGYEAAMGFELICSKASEAITEEPT